MNIYNITKYILFFNQNIILGHEINSEWYVFLFFFNSDRKLNRDRKLKINMYLKLDKMLKFWELISASVPVEKFCR